MKRNILIEKYAIVDLFYLYFLIYKQNSISVDKQYYNLFY